MSVVLVDTMSSKAVSEKHIQQFFLFKTVKRQRAMEITDDMKKFKAFNTVRQARAVARLWGIRAKKAKDAEADDVTNPKKK